MGQEIKHTFVNFSTINIKTILYIKLYYKDADNVEHEIKTSVASHSNTYMHLRLNHIGKLNINYPQTVSIKIITDETMYQTETVLSDLVYHSEWIGFSVAKPERIERIQDREFYRVRTPNKQATVYYADNTNKIQELNSTIFDIALKSIKIYSLQTADNIPVHNFCFDDLKNIKIKIQISSDRRIIIPAVFLKFRMQDDTETYIFKFTALQAAEEAQLSKILMDIQRQQRHHNTAND